MIRKLVSMPTQSFEDTYRQNHCQFSRNMERLIIKNIYQAKRSPIFIHLTRKITNYFAIISQC